MLCQFYSKCFIVRLVSTVMPFSITDNLRERYHAISGYDMLLWELAHHLPYILSRATCTRSTKRTSFLNKKGNKNAYYTKDAPFCEIFLLKNLSIVFLVHEKSLNYFF